jgi:hypothetical protein
MSDELAAQADLTGCSAFVEWCGHQVGVILVPEGDGWYSEIPVLGEAR